MKIISIDGGIGSGKSTIIEALKKEDPDGFIFVLEPIHLWDTIMDEDGNTMLQLFYANKLKYGFTFQMMTYESRLVLLREAIEQNPNAIIITERSLDTDRHVFAKMLHDDGLIEDVCMQIYLKWFDHFIKDINVENVIYIDATPEKCLERIHTRSRPGEELVELSYLSRCEEYYKDMLTKYPESNSLMIDGNIDYDEEGKILKSRLNDIVQFCRSVGNS
jgi:deoxyadenosine/deoxycytidine kinase